MNKYTILGVLVLAQITLLYYQLRSSKTLAQHSISQALLTIEKESVTAVSILDADGKEVRLQSVDQGWQTGDGFSAQPASVEQLIEKISSLKTNLATAHTDTAAQRFQVSEDTFQRKLTIETANSKKIQLFVGSGAGARRSHVRLGSEKAIYSLPLAEYELSTDASEWQDLNCLRLATDTIKLVEINNLTLLKVDGDGVQATEPTEDGADATAAVHTWIGKDSTGEIDIQSEALVSAVRHLSQLRIERADPSTNDLFNERLSLSLQHDQGNRKYQLLQSTEDTSEYWIQASDFEGFALHISETNAEQILANWALAKLTDSAKVTSPEPSSETAVDSASTDNSNPQEIESNNSTAEPDSTSLKAVNEGDNALQSEE
jgi:hypothetical protein